MKNTIVIVDDHILIAKALASIIANFEDFEVLYECENGKELIEKFNLENTIPKIVLLDISMPIMDGYETAKWLKENHPNVLIMALSMQDDEQSVLKMIKNGTTSYLLKNSNPKKLETGLKKLVSEGYYYPEWASKMVFSALSSNSQSELQFSDREIEFLNYVATEMSYKEISDKMFCSPRTVENYRDSLCEKLELKSRVGLAVFAIKNGYNKE